MRKVVIIGAGHVGSHCGYALAHSGIAGEIVLVDVDKDKAHAQALDIADSVSFCERETVVRDGDYKDCEDAALVVVAIGEARKPGQTRLDMLGRSVEMLKELLEQLKPYKIPGIVVTITNPADIVADYVRKGLGLERNRVFGTGTLLDTARLIRTLSEESGVGRRSIQAEKVRRECEQSFMKFIIRDIIFDFSDTSFMDSSGIGLVLGRVRKIHPINGKVYLFGGNELIQKMWEMAGILNLVTVLDSIEKVKEVYE